MDPKHNSGHNNILDWVIRGFVIHTIEGPISNIVTFNPNNFGKKSNIYENLSLSLCLDHWLDCSESEPLIKTGRP